ncbi:hypothetical protein E1A91_D12G149400v1 [Gossypium mustelinum]|uniref:Uncharacterized protein n=1 Tax=Gossypium mustelinum TaxID=34275 RepID=A0A5D2SFK6_GOSMU|nr:hypothetical protein E1A91_D12G149400v1 [Gossypium mustelinum]
MEMVKQDNRRQLCARSIANLFLKIIIKLSAQRYSVEVLQVLIVFKFLVFLFIKFPLKHTLLRHLNSRIFYLCILLCLQVEV